MTVNKYFSLQHVKELLSQKFADSFENLKIKTYLILERPGGTKQKIELPTTIPIKDIELLQDEDK